CSNLFAPFTARHQILNLLNALCSKLATLPPSVGFKWRRLLIAHSSASSDCFFVRCSQAEFVACKNSVCPLHICMLAYPPGRKLLIFVNFSGWVASRFFNPATTSRNCLSISQRCNEFFHYPKRPCPVGSVADPRHRLTHRVTRIPAAPA